MDSLEQSALTQALDRMWTQFLPQMQERLQLVCAGVEAYAAGTLDEHQQLAARDAAHKLAGVLGTFGLASGTVLAREIEAAFECLTAPDEELAARLQRMTGELTTLIEHRR